MRVFREAFGIFRIELTLFTRFPKLRISALGVVIIPALYALIYLASISDPAAHTGELKAALVNLDQGLSYRGQEVNIGKIVAFNLRDKHAFGFVDYAVEEEARAAVRQGQMAFALIIPKDFSANAVPGHEAAGGRLVVYVSEGNNYNGANLAKRFASELGHQVNIKLNEQRWSLVLTSALGSMDKMAQLRSGVTILNDGARRLDTGLGNAATGSKILAAGTTSVDGALSQFADGVKQLGVGLRSMDQQRPNPQDLVALKSGASELASGHLVLSQGLESLHTGGHKLFEGINKLHDETEGLPIVGDGIADATSQLAAGASQLNTGLDAARSGQLQLADGAQKLHIGVSKLTDGVTTLGGGIHAATAKIPPDAVLDELAHSGHAVADGTQELHSGLTQLRTGSRELTAGLALLQQSLPTDLNAPDGSPSGLADSVEPALEVVAPVPNNGAGFAPNFLATSLWLGAVMSAFLFHVRRLPEAAKTASAPARFMGKLGIMGTIVLAQAMVIMATSLFLLDLPAVKLLPYALTLALSSLTFLIIITALTRAFGDAGKAAALLLMVLQLSSAGGVLPVELSGGIYQAVSPWLPFTWVVKALRASMFGAFDGDWQSAWMAIGLIAALASLMACYIGQWMFVSPEEHRPAMDI
jgi:putative membrane protein